MAFKVYVDDNLHYMDESERYVHGTYQKLAEAERAARELVDNFLVEGYQPGMTADKLYEGYVLYGADPFIVDTEGGRVDFSAWQYAKERCQELCGS